jgi:predicted Zn-dependent protease
MFSFSVSRPKGAGAKRSIGRSLANLGLLACFVAVAGAGAGCGGGSNANDDNSTPDPVFTPIVSGDIPFARSAGTRGTIPLAIYPASFTTLTLPSYLLVSPTVSKRLSVPTSSTLAVPDQYADRQFDHFEMNGTNIGKGTHSVVLGVSPVSTIALTSLPTNTNAVLTAVYTPYSPGTGVAFPNNYNAATNARWDSMPVKVCIDKSARPNDGVYQRLKEALNKWSAASGGVISWTEVGEDGSADITLSTADSLSFGDDDTYTTLAVTVPEFQGTLTAAGLQRMKKANIYFLPAYFNLPNATDQRQFESIAAHEFGHALGVLASDDTQGHSPNQEDLMCATVNFVSGEITQHDIATIANIYRAEFDAAK